MSVDFDVKLTGLAAEVLRTAVQGYDPVSALGPVLAARDFTMLGGFNATGSFPALTGSFSVLTGSFVAIGMDAGGETTVTLKRVFKLPGKLFGVLLPSEP